MVDTAIINGVRNYLQKLRDHGIAVSFGVIYGSQATGEAKTWSDIDLLVVSPQFDKAIDRKSIDKLWHVAARTDSRIEPIPCGERQWREDTSSAIIETARNQGTTVQTSN
ncbi:nucleotidyltransferase domain-containing protein [Planctomycetota bacterium]